MAQAASDGHIELADQLIRVAGDFAYELGNEKGSFKLAGRAVSIDLRVTNVYRRENGVWKLVHQHTDLSPAMVDVLRQT